MCGFSVIIDKRGKFFPNDLTEMAKAIKHRGPDDYDEVFIDFQEKKISSKELISNLNQYQVGLAFQRLSILDLSKAGRQPMISKNKNSVIVYNGELFNINFFKKNCCNLDIFLKVAQILK